MWKCMFLSNKIYRGTLCTFFEKSTQKMLIEFYRRSKHKSVRIRNPFNLDFHFSEHKNKFIINFISERFSVKKVGFANGETKIVLNTDL